MGVLAGPLRGLRAFPAGLLRAILALALRFAPGAAFAAHENRILRFSSNPLASFACGAFAFLTGEREI